MTIKREGPDNIYCAVISRTWRGLPRGIRSEVRVVRKQVQDRLPDVMNVVNARALRWTGEEDASAGVP